MRTPLWRCPGQPAAHLIRSISPPARQPTSSAQCLALVVSTKRRPPMAKARASPAIFFFWLLDSSLKVSVVVGRSVGARDFGKQGSGSTCKQAPVDNPQVPRLALPLARWTTRGLCFRATRPERGFGFLGWSGAAVSGRCQISAQRGTRARRSEDPQRPSFALARSSSSSSSSSSSVLSCAIACPPSYQSFQFNTHTHTYIQNPNRSALSASRLSSQPRSSSTSATSRGERLLAACPPHRIT